jgi:hypothetical protein
MAEIGFSQAKSAPTKLFGDRKSAKELASDPIFHEKTKHFEVDFHFIRKNVEDNVISQEHVRTDKQLVDLHTKALGGNRLSEICIKLDMINIYITP